MKKNLTMTLLGALAFMAGCTSQPEGVPVTLNVAEKGASVSPSMYGVFFEEINHAGDGGLYAELVQNRSFEEKEMPEGYHVEHGRLKPGYAGDDVRALICDLAEELDADKAYFLLIVVRSEICHRICK